MNTICKTCDTRNRLGLCLGKDGKFDYCFRKVGSIEGLKETITPFTTIDDLFINCCDYIQSLDKSSLILDSEFYGRNNHMKLMMGKFLGDNDNSIKQYPVGFVIC